MKETKIIETPEELLNVAEGKLVDGASKEVLNVLRELAGAIVTLTAAHNGGTVHGGNDWTDEQELRARVNNAGGIIYNLGKLASKHGFKAQAKELNAFVGTIESMSRKIGEVA